MGGKIGSASQNQTLNMLEVHAHKSEAFAESKLV